MIKKSSMGRSEGNFFVGVDLILSSSKIVIREMFTVTVNLFQ